MENEYDNEFKSQSDIPVAGTEIIAENFELDREMDRRVLRKTDLVVLPLLCLVFFSQYIDKQSLAYTAIFGLKTDLHLVGQQYSWCGSIFYVGQLVSEYPFIYLMSRLPLAKFVGVTIVIWGIICMCLAATNNFAGFAAVRFLLGFSEGAVSPAFTTITSIWYKKSEHPMRVAIWISMNGVAQVIGALLMYGIGKNSSLSIEAWKVMFIICGAMTCVFGMLFYFAMPAGPDTAWFFTPEERIHTSRRLASQHDGGDKTNFSLPQLKEALLDVRTYFTFMFGLLICLPSSVLTFASLVISGLGYDKFQTMLFTAPSGAVQLVFVWIGVLLLYIAPKYRCGVALVLVIVPLVGTILLFVLSLNAGWGMIVASWLASCITSFFSILLSLSASNVRGNTKKAVINASFFIGYCTGCIAAPQLWKSDQAPRYSSGLILGIVSYGVLVLTLVAYWVWARAENKQRDKLEAETHGHVQHFVVGADMTDKEDKTFRYSY